MDFYFKVYRSGGEVLVAACDREVLGRVLQYNGVDVEIKSSFYGEKLCSRSDLLAALRGASIINLMGNKVVELAIEEGLVKKENVLLVGGVMHAQVIVL